MSNEIGFKRLDVTSASLKWVALIKMIIDHVGLALIGYWYKYYITDAMQGAAVYKVYRLCRAIGRASFPLYIFLLLEGLRYTHDRWGYLVRLLVFIFISEIPFDLCFSPVIAGKKTWIHLGYQNVFFTLAIGFAVIWFLEVIYDMPLAGAERVILTLVAVGAGAGAAYLIKSDYNAWGIMAIVAGYFAKKRGASHFWTGLTIISILTMMDGFEAWAAVIDLPLLLFYHGTRGHRGNRYIFYIAYPAHLIILYLIRVYIIDGVTLI